jgi:hypothetical protein
MNLFGWFKKRPRIIPCPADKRYNKIFGIGYPKTGTTSLAVAIRNLGFDIVHDELSLFPKAVIDGDFYITENESWDGCCNIYASQYSILDKTYPDSKFILTTRNSKKWFDSLQSWRNGQEIDVLNKTSHLSELYDFFNVYDEHLTFLQHMSMYGIIGLNKKICIERYEAHNNSVVEYFADKPGKLLVLPLESSPKYPPVCEFLEQPLPDIKYPHEKKVFKRYIP